jgi:ankyrin repeat protein
MNVFTHSWNSLLFSLLIKAGANYNVKDCDGWTPLHAAAHWGQKEACEILLENNCDTSLKNNCVCTLTNLIRDCKIFKANFLNAVNQ